MGWYADCSMEAEFDSYLDRTWGDGYSDDLEIMPEDLVSPSDFLRSQLSCSGYICLEYQSLLNETEKSWLIKINDNKPIWISKKLSKISMSNNTIYIKRWYYNKLQQNNN